MPNAGSNEVNPTAGARRKGHEQFPVDTDILKVVIEVPDLSEILLKMVVMNKYQVSSYKAFHEYHFGNSAVSIANVTSFKLCSSRAEHNCQADIDSFVNSMALSLEVPQVASWYRGVYAPGSVQKRLYKAVDPDDNTRLIGVLLEQDSHGQLVQVTWYKTQDTLVIFQSVPPSLDFELVRDRDGAPSTDPNDIGGWTWYYCPSVGGGS